jgi:phosphatidylinositol alpha-mannosyltransferase
MKIGIVVPYSWSFWGGVPEHADHQARALRQLGVDARIVIGHDPPGRLTKYLHPRAGRHEQPPEHVIPVGRSVIVPANGALPNIVISPSAIARIRRLLERERFDVVHIHEPMTPAIGVATLAMARSPVVATFHASGELGWMKGATPLWGFLTDRLDHRIAVSPAAADSARRYLGGEYTVIPNGVVLPGRADPGGRKEQIVFVGRHEPRKGLPVLLRAWPEIRARTGARLRILGADPLQVRLLLTRLRLPDDGIDALGYVHEDERTAELLAAKAFVAPSLGGESFGMVITEAYACSTPVVGSDIPGYRDVLAPDAAVPVPPGDPTALAEAVVGLVGDEERRRRLGAGARERAKRYSWDGIAQRLLEIYEPLAGRTPARIAATG